MTDLNLQFTKSTDPHYKPQFHQETIFNPQIHIFTTTNPQITHNPIYNAQQQNPKSQLKHINTKFPSINTQTQIQFHNHPQYKTQFHQEPTFNPQFHQKHTKSKPQIHKIPINIHTNTDPITINK